MTCPVLDTQLPCFPWWLRLYQGGNPNSREQWCCQDERGYWFVFPYQQLFEGFDSCIDTQFAYLAGIRVNTLFSWIISGRI